jgi:hypothetical protein
MKTKTREEILAEARDHIAASKEFVAPLPPIEDRVAAWARDSRERMAAEQRARAELRREEQRMAERWQEGEAIAQLRAELAELRGAIAKGDAAVLDVVTSTLMPLFDRVADRLDEASARIDKKLAEMEGMVRASVLEARATAKFFDTSTPPHAGRREVN